NLPSAGSKTFWLDSSAWEYPTFENVDTFVDRLMRKELLVFDPLINMVLQEQPVDMSQRTLQRRFLRATGLTYNTMFQIQRARYATNLLKHGLSILDTVSQVGYADQPHLTRMLKRYMGQTPAQIVSRTLEKPMSLLFKTAPF
ncbi:MAG: helix-turn-helix transcriptional regulator, partial [Anaerolineae bacterium]|nr:helix-turn-helix transcriptional regulator [Anaerolineae bacterium]